MAKENDDVFSGFFGFSLGEFNKRTCGKKRVVVFLGCLKDHASIFRGWWCQILCWRDLNKCVLSFEKSIGENYHYGRKYLLSNGFLNCFIVRYVEDAEIRTP